MFDRFWCTSLLSIAMLWCLLINTNNHVLGYFFCKINYEYTSIACLLHLCYIPNQTLNLEKMINQCQVFSPILLINV